VRKRRAGSDSLGHVWVHDDDTVEMPYDQAMQLIAIRDAGFEIVEPDETSDPPPVRRGRKPSSEKTEITETAS
jgi:hypothetical protein